VSFPSASKVCDRHGFSRASVAAIQRFKELVSNCLKILSTYLGTLLLKFKTCKNSYLRELLAAAKQKT